MKIRKLMLLALSFMAMPSFTLAQAIFQVASTPVTAVSATDQTALSGDIGLTTVYGSLPSVAGKITINYHVPITYPDLSVPGTIAFRCYNGEGIPVDPAITQDPVTSSNVFGRLVLNIPSGMNSVFCRVSGIRVAMAGAGLVNLSADLSSSGNLLVGGQTHVLVISSVGSGINSTTATTKGFINTLTGSQIIDPVITIKEGFFYSWVLDAGIRITLSAPPSPGVTICFPANAKTDANALFTTATADGSISGVPSCFDNSSTSLFAYYKKTGSGPNDPIQQETLTISPILTVSSSSILPLPTQNISYLVSLAPIGSAFGPDNAFIPAPIPRYAAADIGPETLLSTRAGSTKNVTLTGQMKVARYRHCAVLLPNGKVLVAGGNDAWDHATASAELYDPATGVWTLTGSMNIPRAVFTATLLGNGKVLVAGGRDGNIDASSAELYDPSTGTWSFTGSMSEKRTEHQAELLPDGKVLVFGGWHIGYTALASAELYDPSTGTWTTVGSMSGTRAGFASGVLGNGKVLAAGGLIYSGQYQALQSSELYDPNTKTWASAGNMTAPRGLTWLSVLSDGSAFIAGGGFAGDKLSSTERFAPATGIWIAGASMALPRTSATTNRLPTGEILIVGGEISYVVNTGVFEIYNPVTNSWRLGGNLTYAHKDHTATLLPNGRILIAGGLDDANWLTAAAELITTQHRLDFDGDGKTDILWRDSSTGEVLVWFMNGIARARSAPIGIVADFNWKIAGLADFSEDKETDILWRNSLTGEICVWYMNGATFTRYASIGLVTDPNWKIAGIEDFSNDGKPDILWHNSSTGEIYVWYIERDSDNWTGE